MSVALWIDGIPITSDEVYVTDLKIKFSILSEDKSGRLQSGEMKIFPIGTYYNYTWMFHRRSACSNEKWDSLCLLLSDPKSVHKVTLPFFDDSLQEFDMYISEGEIPLKKAVMDEKAMDFRYEWGDITVTFTAMQPQRR